MTSFTPKGLLLVGVAALAGLLTAGCGDDPSNYIDGSLAASYDMKFDTVRIRRFSTEVSVEYVVNPGPGEELALKLAVNFELNEVRANSPIDLHQPSGSVDRNRVDGATFPDLCPQDERPSTLTFESYGEVDGARIRGKWRLCFVNGLDGIGGFSDDLQVIE